MASQGRPHRSKEPTKESHILVLYTGGTIGMKRRPSDGALVPEPNYLESQLRQEPIFNDPDYKVDFVPQHITEEPLVLPQQKDGSRIVYYVHEYSPLLDSSNMSFDDYVHITTDIKTNYTDFDGFIVLHGTDTMAYTASALSFMLENLGKTTIITGSQIPIFDTRTDGRINFLDSLVIAGGYVIPEVTLCFNSVLLRGNRSTKADAEAFDAFTSPNMDPLAEMGVDIKVDFEAIHSPKGKEFCVHTDMVPDVGVLRFFPGITVQTIEAFLAPPTKGVVLQTFGAGNGPTAREDIMKALKEACDRGVIIVNCTQCFRGTVSTIYAAGQDLEDIGVTAGSDMTTEAALMKLSYVLSLDKLSVEQKRKMMSENLRGELTVIKPTPEPHTHKLVIAKLAEVLQLSSSKEKAILKNTVFTSMVCSAARDGDTTSLETLKQCGAHFHVSDHDRRTPLHIAASEGKTDAVKYLLENGALVHVKDRHGRKPLDDAISFNHSDVKELLTKAGAH